MTKQWIQFAGLIALSLLAAGLLGIIAYAIYLMGQHITTDGKVPVLDAGLFTSSLLSFQQTVGGIRSIWESQERQSLSESLSNSTPTGGPAPQDAKEAARDVAGAASDKADQIEGEPV